MNQQRKKCSNDVFLPHNMLIKPYTHTSTHHIHAHILHTNTLTCIHTCVHICVRTQQSHTHARTHACTHARTHAHTHTHTHTQHSTHMIRDMADELYSSHLSHPFCNVVTLVTFRMPRSGESLPNCSIFQRSFVTSGVWWIVQDLFDSSSCVYLFNCSWDSFTSWCHWYYLSHGVCDCSTLRPIPTWWWCDYNGTRESLIQRNWYFNGLAARGGWDCCFWPLWVSDCLLLSPALIKWFDFI